MTDDLCDRVKQTARQAGADLVGVASVDRFDHAPPEVHPHSMFSHTQSVIAVGCRMVRGALKTAEEGLYWGAYNCDSYQYINEVLAPHLLRRIVLLLEDQGYTAVPIHNPFHPHTGRPVHPGDMLTVNPAGTRSVGPGNAILMSFDPVAHDAIGLQRTVEVLTARGGYPKHTVEQATPCLEHAAEIGLGTNDPDNTEVVEIELG